MVQVLGAVARRPSIGQRLSESMGAAASTAGQYAQNEKAKQMMAQENEVARQQFGIDLSGTTDPKARQALMVQALKGQQKNQQMGQKQEFLGKLFGGGQQQQQGGQLDDMQQQGAQGFDPSNISDADIARATAIDPAMGRELRAAKDTAIREKHHSEDIDLKKSETRRAEETKISTPVMLELNEMRKNIPLQEQAVQDIINATPKVSGRDYLADITGFEPLRTSEGAKLKTSIKDFFLSDLTRAGARPNQWIEQQLMDALPKIGRSTEANLVTAEGMKFKVDLVKKRAEIIDELAEKDRDKYGYVRADIDSRAYKEMKKYVVDRQSELEFNIKKIKAQNKGKTETVKMKSPDGSIYEINMDDIDEAKGAKFDFVD